MVMIMVILINGNDNSNDNIAPRHWFFNVWDLCLSPL